MNVAFTTSISAMPNLETGKVRALTVVESKLLPGMLGMVVKLPTKAVTTRKLKSKLVQKNVR